MESDEDATVSWDLIDQHNSVLVQDSDSEEEQTTDSSVGDELAQWINEYQVKHNAVDSL